MRGVAKRRPYGPPIGAALLVAVALATMAPGIRTPGTGGGLRMPGEGPATGTPRVGFARADLGEGDERHVSFGSVPAGSGTPKMMRARFNLPKAASGKVPAVVYAHVTQGVDGRGAFNAFALNEAGIATVEIDMWEAAGLLPRQNDRALLTDREQYASAR